MLPDNGHDFLEHECEQEGTAATEDNIVDPEKGVELLRLPWTLEFLNGEDEDEIVVEWERVLAEEWRVVS